MIAVSIPPKINLQAVRILMVAEALPENLADYFYESRRSLYVTNTVGAFKAAGIEVNTIDDILAKGVYLTVAVKAPRHDLAFPSEVIREHSFALEAELNQLPNLKAILLMGDAAIKSLNFIAQRVMGDKCVPTGSTYKIRGGVFYFKTIRVFPSYLQTGKNFLIEKAKRVMVAEDIRNAFNCLATD